MKDSSQLRKLLGVGNAFLLVLTSVVWFLALR